MSPVYTGGRCSQNCQESDLGEGRGRDGKRQQYSPFPLLREGLHLFNNQIPDAGAKRPYTLRTETVCRWGSNSSPLQYTAHAHTTILRAAATSATIWDFPRSRSRR